MATDLKLNYKKIYINKKGKANRINHNKHH